MRSSPLLLLVSACHLATPYASSSAVDGRADTRGPAGDAAPPPVDLSEPSGDSGAAYVDEDFEGTPGKVAPERGQWAVENGALRQRATDAFGHYALASLSAGDYAIETEVMIHGTAAPRGTFPGAGVGARVQPPAGADPPAAYLCVIAPSLDELVMAECSGFQPTCQVIGSAQATIELASWYRLVMTVEGASITCGLPQLTVSFSRFDGSLTSGGVALSTSWTDASFGYLKVTAR